MADAVDSKSTSLTGVGVRVPSLVPPSARRNAHDRELACALARAVDRRIASACVRLEARTDEREPWPSGLRELGWVFGMLGRALGSDLLGQRREREGLVTLSALLDEVLRERGSGLCIEGRLPAPGRVQDGGLDAAWGLAVLAWIAARGRRAPLRVSVVRDGGAHRFRIAGAVGEERLAALRAARPRLPGTGLESDPDGCTLVLSGPCLVER